MKTHANFDNAISFDELLETENKAEQLQQRVWIATIGQYAPLMMDRPSPLQDNVPLCLK